jgi:hypothetical protein
MAMTERRPLDASPRSLCAALDEVAAGRRPLDPGQVAALASAVSGLVFAAANAPKHPTADGLAVWHRHEREPAFGALADALDPGGASRRASTAQHEQQRDRDAAQALLNALRR